MRTTEEYHRWIEENERLTDRDRGAIARHIAAFTHKPLISVVTPTHNTPARFLKRAIDSVCAQLYDRWELCIADDASTELHVRQILDQYAGTGYSHSSDSSREERAHRRGLEQRARRGHR